MVNIAQIVSIALSLALLAGGSYIMHMFFGIIGVALLVVLTGLIVGIIAVFSSGGGGSSSGVSRQSKGARQSQED
jgi:hypothetical protein